MMGEERLDAHVAVTSRRSRKLGVPANKSLLTIHQTIHLHAQIQKNQKRYRRRDGGVRNRMHLRLCMHVLRLCMHVLRLCMHLVTCCILARVFSWCKVWCIGRDGVIAPKC
jgi:hypothetical protein